LAKSYSLAGKRAEAFALYSRARSLAEDALNKFQSIAKKDEVSSSSFIGHFMHGFHSHCEQKCTMLPHVDWIFFSLDIYEFWLNFSNNAQGTIQELKTLIKECRANSCIEHATGIMEEERAPENLSNRMSTISLNNTAAQVQSHYLALLNSGW